MGHVGGQRMGHVVGGLVQHLVQVRDPDRPIVAARVCVVLGLDPFGSEQVDHRLLLAVGRVAAPDDDVGPQRIGR